MIPPQDAAYPELRDRTIFVTGGARGLGAGIAEAFSAAGASVALFDIDGETASAVARELTDRGGRAIAIQGSVTDESEVEAAVATTVSTFGRIDVVSGNAGVSANVPSLDITAEAWRRTIDVDLTGAFLTSRAAARVMMEQGGGVILHTSSIWGVASSPARAAYCAAKAGLVSMTKCLAVEWASQGLRVNTLAPGYVRTPLLDRIVEAGRVDIDAVIGATPLGRLGTIQDVARLALFLASDAASFITGQTIVADGGWTSNDDLLSVGHL